MLVLALDTTTRPGSVALVRDAELLAVRSGIAAETHAERLPAAIVRLLEDAGLALSAIDVFGVAAGPGSFTGLRIGIATIQGLAFALNRPVVGVSCLDVLALIAQETAVGTPPPLVAAWMDAQRQEVFAALYEVRAGRAGASQESAASSAPGLKAGSPTTGEEKAGSPTGEVNSDRQPSDRWRVIDGPVSERPANVLERWEDLAAGRSVRLAGDGVGRYRDLLLQHLHGRFTAVEPLPPLAPVIGRMTREAAAAGRTVAPHAVRPIYVRRPDAELARDRRPAPATDPSDVR